MTIRLSHAEVVVRFPALDELGHDRSWVWSWLPERVLVGYTMARHRMVGLTVYAEDAAMVSMIDEHGKVRGQTSGSLAAMLDLLRPFERDHGVEVLLRGPGGSGPSCRRD